MRADQDSADVSPIFVLDVPARRDTARLSGLRSLAAASSEVDCRGSFTERPPHIHRPGPYYGSRSGGNELECGVVGAGDVPGGAWGVKYLPAGGNRGVIKEGIEWVACLECEGQRRGSTGGMKRRLSLLGLSPERHNMTR